MFIVGVAISIYNKKVAVEQLYNDGRLKGAKIFKEWIEMPMAITQKRNIGIINPTTKNTKVFNIKDVNGFEVIINGKNIANVGGAIAGSLLF
ncbi:MAG: hypothetical protein LBD93_09945 [Treponema sp.]|nr:hypothetical protein [Treponema sp.]